MAMLYLWIAAGHPSAPASSQFADVRTDASYTQAVAWAVNQGITSGTSNAQFSPDSVCTRSQIVTFLYRAANPTAASVVLPAWSQAYKNFVTTQQFLTVQYPYDSVAEPPWGMEDAHIVRLHDFDADGIPELIISNGYFGQITKQSYVYTYSDNQIRYIGNCDNDPSYIPGSLFGGVFGEWHTTYEDHSVGYYGKNGNQIVYETVYTYNLLDEANKHRETSNEALFQESQKQRKGIHGISVPEIVSNGWESFVQSASN